MYEYVGFIYLLNEVKYAFVLVHINSCMCQNIFIVRFRNKLMVIEDEIFDFSNISKHLSPEQNRYSHVSSEPENRQSKYKLIYSAVSWLFVIHADSV